MNNNPEFSENSIKRLFPSFQPELVQKILDQAELKTFDDGELMMRTGQYFRSTMLVVHGLIKVFREDDEGNEFFMYYLQPGEACALSMICATRQETSQIKAMAVGETEVLAIPISVMDEWMLNYKSWYYFVLETYRSRFEELLVTIDHIAFRNMDERLVFYLKRHRETVGSNIINLSFTQIAQELNSSREVISRLMKKLSEKGMVRLNGSHVEIIDLNF